MSAWLEEQDFKNIDKTFEDNFVSVETEQFKKLEDSESYLQVLESRLKKLKKDPSVLKQLKEKREECFKNLLNNSFTIRSEQDLELEEEVNSNKIISHLIPAQPQTIGEIAHLVKHDELDQQKQEAEEEAQVVGPEATAEN